MVWLPDGEKISKIYLFVLAQLANVIYTQTHRHYMPAYTALMHMHRVVIIQIYKFNVYGAVIMTEPFQ